MSYITPKTDFTANDHYNYTDINRVAGNIQYMADLLRDSGYEIDLLPFEPDFTLSSCRTYRLINKTVRSF
jgi:hypothetical protein